MDWTARLCWCLFVSLGIWLEKGVRSACTMAHFPCRNQQCITLDKYCDGNKDCTDGSDEPTGCSPCNRTYYGRVGVTYRVRILKPRRGSFPHFCQLTFMASGDIYGDLVQISFEKFNLGRFVSHTTAGCPDGYMQIEELSKPSTNSGYWCGSAWGHNVFYSETSSVSIMLRVFNLSDQVSMTMTSDDNILLQISYRFIIQERAVLRYGVPYSPSFLGEDVIGTFCDKFLEKCDKRNCKIQSPNYPGMYPRNLTCYYHIKQDSVPDGKVALIRVRQRNPHLIYIKDRNTPHLSTEAKFQLGNSCHILHDYIIIFDGNSTQNPILLKACKGSDLTPITSSGSEMLILFHVSPFDFPFQDYPRRKIFGFQLEVEVVLVGRESTAYVRHNHENKDLQLYSSSSLPVPASVSYSCQWEFNSRGQRSGYVQTPAHSILKNTTCTWRLIAGPSEVVWLYFLHYRHIRHFEMPTPTHCPNNLSIYDGEISTKNATFLGSFCKEDSYPRVCSGVHASASVTATAPCPSSESYVSQSSALILNLQYDVGTIPSHIEFLARYEFVDQRQWGEPMRGGGKCDRMFHLSPERLFASPRNVFLFGRGGSRKLHCTYTFKVSPYERIIIKILQSKIGSVCNTVLSNSSHKHECNHSGEPHFPSLKLEETLWSNVVLTRACLCNISDVEPFSIKSYTNEISLIFNIPKMNPAEDYDDYYFEGEYEIVKANKKDLCKIDEHQYDGKYGNFTIGFTEEDSPCITRPYLLHAEEGSFLYLKIQGYSIQNSECNKESRINVYAVGKSMPIASICPEISDKSAYVFSNGWMKSNRNSIFKKSYDIYNSFRNYSTSNKYSTYRHRTNTPLRGFSRDLVLEYTGNVAEEFLVMWIGVWRPIRTATLSSAGADLCPHRCPEIEACLPPELWCDGTAHCPLEVDEGASACGILAALPWVSLGVGIALLISLMILLAAVVRHRKKQEYDGKPLEVSTVQNNGYGIKNATQDLLTPLKKDPTW